MTDVLAVAVGNSGEYLFDYLSSVFFRKTFSRDDLVKEFSTLTKLSYEINVFNVFKHLEQAQNVWMSEILQDIDLILQPSLLWRGNVSFLHYLDRANFPSHLMRTSHDFSIPAYNVTGD